MCAAKRHVRFTPNSDRKSGLPQTVMSALPLKADMCGAIRDVRFGPIADILRRVSHVHFSPEFSKYPFFVGRHRRKFEWSGSDSRLDPVAQTLHSFGFGAVVAAVKRAVFLQAVAHDLDSTMST